MVTFNIHASAAITGTPSATTFLRGDGTWNTPIDTNTTYTANETNITLSGTEFRLKNKTSYMTIAGCAFISDTPATDNVMMDYDNGVLFVVSGSIISAGCSVQLPQGAVVTGVKVVGTGTWTWYLLRDTLVNSGFPVTMATDANGTEDTTISSATIDNSLYRYWFEVYALGTNETVDSARIKYTTDYN